MTIAPQFRAFLDAEAALGLSRLSQLSPAAARAQAVRHTELIGPGPDVAALDELLIPVADATIRARRYVPISTNPYGEWGTLVWFHGGGWVLGGLKSHDAVCRTLAAQSGVRVIAVDYRLAPEYPFPVPLEDCWSALRWIAARAPQPVIVGGDGAGGNLAAVCALRARDAGAPRLAAQVLVYPVTDHDFATASYTVHGGQGTLLGRAEMEWFWDHYLPEGPARDDWQASPLRAAELTRVAPAIMVLAGHDPLLDEGRAYAARLRAAGVSVSEHQYGGAIHPFFQFVGVFDQSDEAVFKVALEVGALAFWPEVLLRRVGRSVTRGWRRIDRAFRR